LATTDTGDGHTDQADLGILLGDWDCDINA